MKKYLRPKKYAQFIKRQLSRIMKCTPVIRKHHRLRRRVDCILDACDLIRGKRAKINSFVFNKTIASRLLWLGINFNQLPTNQKSNLYAVFADLPFPLDHYDEIKRNIDLLPSTLLPCQQWLKLHEMCCFRGMYTLAQIFREKARMLAIKPLEGHAFKPPISWENTMGAAIEGGECHRPEELDQLLERAGISGQLASQWHLYMAALNGHEIPEGLVKHFDGSGFADYLASKTIAVVGPAPTEALDAEKIDSHDLVVRLKHSCEGKGTDQKHKGLRTDITCFNKAAGIRFMQERKGILPREATWGCFKSRGVVSSAKETNKEKWARAHITFNQLQFHGSYNMIPIVALDFALFNANSIKIYHTDLMLTVARQKGYSGSNFKTIGNMKKQFKKSSIAHDPVQQYRTLNSLWRNEKITGDARFVEVMEMGLDAYLSELERVYANPHAQLGPSNA